MADRRVRAIVGVVPDIQSGQQTKQLLDEINKELNKLQRSQSLRQVARDAADLVKQGKSSRVAVANLQAELIKVGANRKEVAGVVKEFDRLAESAKRSREETERLVASLPDPDFGSFGLSDPAAADLALSK
jgi:ABC-type transporter Mla subunit MlaD